MKNFTIDLIGFSILFFFIGCSKISDSRLNKLSKVYIDLEIAETTAPNSDSLKILEGKVFERYNLSREEYFRMIKKIPTEKEAWKKFFTFAEKYLDSLRLQNLSNTGKENNLQTETNRK